MSKIIVVGSSNTDMVVHTSHLPVPGETILGGKFLMNQGGKGANQAVAVKRLGGDLLFVARVGNDVLGQQTLRVFQNEGIETSYIALDNVDNALNPGLVKNLMNNIIDIISKNENKQIFLTTHNPTTLDAIDLFNEKHRLFVVERAEDGQSKFKRIKPPEGMTKEEWIDKYYGMKLSEIWLSGAIGGLPKGF
jgi:sugar/nucleoside kinase (ribokinase family)